MNRQRSIAAEPTGLLEREPELGRARHSLSELVAGHGRLLVVEAEAGLGKTTLLQAIGREAAGLGMDVLAARGSVLEGEFAFGIVRQWLDQLSRHDPVELARIFTGPARVVAGLMDPSLAADPSVEGDAFAVLHGLYWALAALSTQRPLVLVLDDAHWADLPSLRFAAFLQPRIRELAVLLVVGVRPSAPGARSTVISSLTADPAADTLHPSPLSVAAVGELAEAHLGAAPASEFVAACHRATAGNPFYLQMLLAELARRGVQPESANAALVEDIGPSNVSRAVLLQLANLAPETIPLAKALAVLGGEADEAVLAAVAGVDEEAAAAGADGLRRAAVIDPEQLRPRFVHPIVRAAVYGDMGASERAEAHARAARVLQASSAAPESVAGQLLLTSPVGESWALECLHTAGRQAAARGAPEVAMTYFRRALEERVTPAARAEVLASLGTAEAQLMDPDSVEHLTAALEVPGKSRWRAGVARSLARALGFLSRVAEAIGVLERVAAEVGDHDPELSLALTNEIVYYGRVDREGRPLTRDRAVALTAEFSGRSRAETPAERIAFLNAAAEVTMRGDSAEEGARLAEEAVRDGLLLTEQTVASPIPPAAVLTLIYCDRFELARRVVEEGLAQAVRSGSILGFAHYSLLRAEVGLRLGELEEAEADGRASLQSVRVPGVVAQQVGVLVRILVERGDLAAAQALLEERRMTGELRDAFHVKELLERRGRLRLAQGRPDEALADLLRAGERQLAFDMPNPATLAWRSQAALAHHRLGQLEPARELAAEEVRLARAFGAPRALGAALVVAGLVANGSGGELLEEAVSVLEPSPARLDLAQALIERGAWLRRQGERVAARPLLTRGLELARECGAQPQLDRASEELASAGGRARNVLRTGRDALTPTELRVARLAAEGLSNPEIAQAQFVTLKTVETQLGSCYRKLGIASRRELASALAAKPD